MYVDVLLLVNFFMDYILLLFVWRVLHCETRHKNIVLGALVGALLYCILIILPIPNAFLEFILSHLVVNTCMIQVGLKIKKISVLLKALILLYVGAFFMGGFMESLYQYVKVGSLFFILAVGGYYLAIAMWKFLCKVQNRNICMCKVQLLYEDQCLTVTALVDTGNGLYDPLTSLPVSVLEKDAAKELFGEALPMVRYIPYRSIGKSEGVIPVVRIKEMRLLGEEPRLFSEPLIGISEESLSVSGEYELILNPNLF